MISGTRAQFKGSGTVNGAGDLGFLLTAVDGQPPGAGGTDRFRIKIWDRATGQVMYDDQAGAGDSSDPTTALVEGKIALHQY